MRVGCPPDSHPVPISELGLEFPPESESVSCQPGSDCRVCLPLNFVAVCVPAARFAAHVYGTWRSAWLDDDRHAARVTLDGGLVCNDLSWGGLTSMSVLLP